MMQSVITMLRELTWMHGPPPTVEEVGTEMFPSNVQFSNVTGGGPPAGTNSVLEVMPTAPPVRLWVLPTNVQLRNVGQAPETETAPPRDVVPVVAVLMLPEKVQFSNSGAAAAPDVPLKLPTLMIAAPPLALVVLPVNTQFLNVGLHPPMNTAPPPAAEPPVSVNPSTRSVSGVPMSMTKMRPPPPALMIVDAGPAEERRTMSLPVRSMFDSLYVPGATTISSPAPALKTA